MANKGVIELVFSDISLKETVNLSLEPIADHIKQKEIELSVDVSDSIQVNADVAKLTWIIVNLLGNAIRYTKRWGQLGIIAKEDGNFVSLEIKNSGEGLTADQVEKIFKPLVENKSTTKVGLGLSLTICKEILEAHGGGMSAYSKLGESTTFNLKLPIS